MSLLNAVETELANLFGGSVDERTHAVLSRHLAFANVAAHVAQEAANLQADPLVSAAESAFLPAGVRAALAALLPALEAEFASAKPQAQAQPESQLAAS